MKLKFYTDPFQKTCRFVQMLAIPINCTLFSLRHQSTHTKLISNQGTIDIFSILQLTSNTAAKAIKCTIAAHVVKDPL